MKNRQYSTDPLVELQNRKGIATGIAAAHVFYRMTGSLSQGKAFQESAYWYMGLMNGDPAKIAMSLETYKSMTSMSKKTLGNEKTGSEFTTSLNLKAFPPEIKAFSYGSKYQPIVSFTDYPGNRKNVITLAGPLVTSNTFAISFTTTNVETDVTSAATVVNVTFSADHATTGAAIITAIKANAGIDQTLTSLTGNIFTIVTKPKHILNVTSALALGGTTPPSITSNVFTDTSIIEGTVEESNGEITRMGFGTSAGFAAKIKAAIDNAVEGGVPQLRLLTGDPNTGQQYESPYVERVDITENYVYLKTSLAQLPPDLTDVKVISSIEYLPSGESLPAEIEILIDYRDHSDKSLDMVYIPAASLTSGTEAASRASEGEVCTLAYVMLEDIFTINGKNVMLPCRIKTHNSVVGAY